MKNNTLVMCRYIIGFLRILTIRHNVAIGINCVLGRRNAKYKLRKNKLYLPVVLLLISLISYCHTQLHEQCKTGSNIAKHAYIILVALLAFLIAVVLCYLCSGHFAKLRHRLHYTGLHRNDTNSVLDWALVYTKPL